jgi:hypothetical protein
VIRLDGEGRSLSKKERALPLNGGLREELKLEYVVQCVNSPSYPQWASLYFWALPKSVERFKKLSSDHESPKFLSYAVAIRCCDAINKNKNFRARVIHRLTQCTEVLMYPS